MADRLKPHGVSGESRTGRSPGDFVDAEWETVPPDAARAPPDSQTISTAAAPASGMDTLRAEAPPAQRTRERGGPLFWTTGVAVAAAAFWVSGGHALVRSASVFEGREPVGTLAIMGVTSRVDASGMRPMLLVDGEAANDGAAAEALPPLDIVVTGNDGRITRYTLGTSGRRIAPGERFAFSSRLDVPINGVRTVTVTFGQ